METIGEFGFSVLGFGMMKLIFLTVVTMLAFAANSLLNRAALAEDLIGPGSFASIRVGAGVVMLVILLMLRDRRLPQFEKPNPAGVIGLSAYMLGFSYAYLSLDAGLGALILFGGVQITMFAGGLLTGDRPPLVRWIGMSLSMSGLALLFWPSDTGQGNLDIVACLLMGVAALGWGAYSLIGRTVKDPLAATTWNFAYTLPIAGVALLLLPDYQTAASSGIILAVISGAITSAMGYALWYTVLPRLDATVGALSQLSVPIIALFFSILWLGEELTTKGAFASLLVLGGISVGILGTKLIKK